MAQDNERRDRKRRTRFETFEERLALSAQPVGDLFPSDGDYRLEQHYSEFTQAILPNERGDFGIENIEEPFTSFDPELFPHLNDSDALTGLDQVRNYYGFTGAGQTVAIIDSGIAYDHYALGRGFGADYRVVGGWDFAENDSNPYDDGPAGFHGTHVAGIVGSTDSRYTGVAPGVDLVALRVFDDNGTGYFSWTEQALRWVHEHRNDFENPITTVNLSLGTSWNADTPPNWAMLEDEFALLKADGIFISVSAGNSFTSYNAPGLSYPAASQYVVPVSSVDNSGNLSYFSQRNSRVIAAPGRNIMSTVPDYVTGSDGTPNDFASASGTSMAAPYVAGASALIREAMQFVGMTGITQDTIYNHIRNTADVIQDAATNASYFRLNVQRAIEALMPTDDYGSTANTAHALGTLSSDFSLNGTISRLNDLDYFTFTAGQSGRITLSTSATHDLALNLQIAGASASVNGDEITFDVIAGQSYTMSLGTTAGIGHYEIDAQWTPTGLDLGIVEFSNLADQQITGTSSYRITAARDGILTVQGDFLHANGNVDFELYNSNNELVAASRSATNQERVDWTVTQDQTFTLRVSGNNSDVDLRIANLVEASNGRVTVSGTQGADNFVFAAGVNASITVNGLTYQFNSSQFSQFSVNGGAGYNTFTYYGTTAKDQVTFRTCSGEFTTATLHVDAQSIEKGIAYSGGGNDVCNFYDSAGNDEFYTNASFARMAGGSCYYYAEGFQNVYAYAQSGGIDRADIYDTVGDDELISTPEFTRLQGGSLYRYAAGFETVAAHAVRGGNDRVDLYGTAGDDRLIITADTARIEGGGTLRSARGFDRVYAFSGGGNDRADLYDSLNDDEIIITPQFARMSSINTYCYVADFDMVFAYATSGGYDRAGLYDSAGNDEIIMTPTFSRMFGDNYYSYVAGFERVEAFASDGDDRADLYDSAGDDQFRGTTALGRMYGNGYYNLARGFDRTYGFSTAGGSDFAELFGSGSGDELIARSNYSRLLGPNFYQYAQGFQLTNVYAGGSILHTSTAAVIDGSLLQGNSSSSQSTSTLKLYGFAVVTSRDNNAESENTFHDVAALDFLFERMGEDD